MLVNGRYQPVHGHDRCRVISRRFAGRVSGKPRTCPETKTDEKAFKNHDHKITSWNTGTTKQGSCEKILELPSDDEFFLMS